MREIVRLKDKFLSTWLTRDTKEITNVLAEIGEALSNLSSGDREMAMIVLNEKQSNWQEEVMACLSSSQFAGNIVK